MTGTEIFAFVVMPIVVVAIGGIVVLVNDYANRREDSRRESGRASS